MGDLALYIFGGMKKFIPTPGAVFPFPTVWLLVMALASRTPLTGYGGRELLIGLGLAVLCTLMGHSLFSFCLKFLSPAYVSAVKLCEPVISGLLAVPLFGEIPTPLQLAGMALVLGSVLLYTRAELPKRA